MAFSAATDAAPSSKSPNTVAPEPDMRARRQPVAARIDASASPIAGASAIAAVSRSLRPPAMTATSRDRSIAGAIVGCGEAVPRSPRPSVRNTAAVATGTPGFASTAKSGGRRKGGPSTSPGPADHAGARLKAHRHVGAGLRRRRQDRRIVSGEAVEAGEQPQRRGGIGRAAAEAGRDRQALRQMESARAQAGHAPRERPRRLEDEVVGLAASGVRGRAGDGQAQLARPEAQIIAGAGEGDQAFEFVIAVGPAAEDVQRQVDLGRGAGGKRPRCH